MSKLRYIGFSKELPHGIADGESIFDHINTIELSEKSLIIKYLDCCNVLASSPSIVYDVINNKNIIGSIHILTDGIWVWPSDLIYYVKNYNVGLPSEFYAYMEVNNWLVKKIYDKDMRGLPLI